MIWFVEMKAWEAPGCDADSGWIPKKHRSALIAASQLRYAENVWSPQLPQSPELRALAQLTAYWDFLASGFWEFRSSTSAAIGSGVAHLRICDGKNKHALSWDATMDSDTLICCIQKQK